MQKNTSLSDKLQQHEFEYRAGAWEEMESLLNAATPITQNNRTLSIHKWLKYLGVAAVMGAIVFFYNNTKQESVTKHNDISQEKMPDIATPNDTPIKVTELQNADEIATEQSETKAMGIKKSANTNKLSSTNTNKVSTESSLKTHQSSQNDGYAEPVDDSKVYRENKNHKHAHQITDENSKAPAASDLHH